MLKIMKEMELLHSMRRVGIFFLHSDKDAVFYFYSLVSLILAIGNKLLLLATQIRKKSG